MNMDFEVVDFYLLTLAKRQSNKNRKMIKLLARPSNNAEQFCGQRKEILSSNTSQNFVLVNMRFGLSLVQSLIFCHLLQCRGDHFTLTKY